MTVKELIKELQKMPPNAKVCYQDFDADPYGISSFPSFVQIIDFDLASEYEDRVQNDFKLKGKVVCIHA